MAADKSSTSCSSPALKGVEQAVNWGKDLLLAKVSRYFIIILELVQLFCICCAIRFGGSLAMMMSGTQRGPKRMQNPQKMPKEEKCEHVSFFTY